MRFDLSEVQRFIAAQTPASKIYIGADSCRLSQGNTWFADYTLVVVVHIDGKHGCKLFGETVRERDYDQRVDRPQMRLMNEVYKVAELYLKLAPVLVDRDVEVHLDISPDPENGSHCVVQQAIGYIRGVCNVQPRVKPHAFAASCAADRYKELASLSGQAARLRAA
ncbi:MAG: ribonuclease H-like YkuK family protein [Burkholderiaceae bacterium]|jgi:predicted RNase H-related nuclease YkuK (DUF458 family)